ncbi:MAG: type II toxin-antitoxin system PemK/MazF family toxin [Methanosarcinales archaeon]|nr:type II toxin-antitoxin system PemK/MazF family toxin [Methanosarcinales archaeon]
MRNYQIGEIVLLAFPYADQRGVKRRPALVLLDAGNGDVVVARVTSRQMQTRVRCEIDRMETSWTFAAIGCAIAQVGNIAKNACRTAVGCFNDKGCIEGQSKRFNRHGLLFDVF